MDPLTPFQEDVLAAILRTVHLRTALYCRARLRGPWGLGVPRRDVAVFHIVTHGTCWLTVEGASIAPLALREGDLVILPHGHAHAVADQPNTPVSEFEDFVSRHPPAPDGMIYAEGPDAPATLVCGSLQLEDHPAHPLYALLPVCLHVRGSEGPAVPWISAIMGMVRAEMDACRPGTEAVITRLSEILFIQAVREHLRTLEYEQSGWLSALKDAQIGQVLALIQRQPAEPWTVASLAARIGLSRSAFSMKFTRLVGIPPLRYLTNVRLAQAAALLRSDPATLLAVALAVGYESEVALSKAFKRQFGIAPGAYRRGAHPLRS